MTSLSFSSSTETTEDPENRPFTRCRTQPVTYHHTNRLHRTPDALDPVDSFAPNMSASTNAVARLDISITTVARNLGPNAPSSTPAGQLGSGMRPAAGGRDLQQLILGHQDRRCGQIDHLMARRVAHNPSLGKLVPALATQLETNRERLVGAVDACAPTAYAPAARVPAPDRWTAATSC